MKRLKKIDIYLWVSITAVVAYTVAVFAVGPKTGWNPPDVVSGGVYGFFGTEIFHCSKLKIKSKGE